MALAIYSDKGTQGAALPRTSVIGIALSLAAPTVGAGNALNIRIARDISQQLGPDTPPPLPALATALLSHPRHLPHPHGPLRNHFSSSTAGQPPHLPDHLRLGHPHPHRRRHRLAPRQPHHQPTCPSTYSTTSPPASWPSPGSPSPGSDGVAHPKLLFLGAALVTFANVALFITRDTKAPITGPRPR